jgi:hypothetical protein
MPEVKNDGKIQYEYIAYDRTATETTVVAEGKVLASSQRMAERLTDRNLPDDLDLEKVEVVVRPFR